MGKADVERDVVRFLGHPLHASMIHFPIGLLGLAPLWDLLALSEVAGPWWAIGFWVVVAGVVLALPAALVGVADLVRAVKGSARGIAILHMGAILAAVGTYAATLIVRGGPEPVADRGGLVLALDAIGLLFLMIGGWLGGQLVFHHGVGQRRRPPPPATP